MNKKYVNIIAGLLIASILCACGTSDEYMVINGTKIKTKLVNSGYYLDKASLSEAQLKDAIDRIVTIEKPESLGTVEFSKKIEDISIESASPSEVTVQEVESAIEKKRDEYQEERIVTKKRACQKGDTVIMNFTGKVDGVEFPGGKAVDEEITLGDGKMLEDFEKGIIGHMPGKNF
ncbi:MAG: FKBP-type peptidyl-prolyl cis-trans isomerase, partial [Lachnospiraceae bacterium]|nr:FKBP-type peptidyl-prolyl cis-trans isomerase [Lachnospiraceae bacterium]